MFFTFSTICKCTHTFWTLSKDFCHHAYRNFMDNEVCLEIFLIPFLSGLEEKHYRIIPIIIGTLPSLSQLDPSFKVALQSTKRQRFGQKLLWEMVRFAMREKSHITEVSGSDDDIDMSLLKAWQMWKTRIYLIAYRFIKNFITSSAFKNETSNMIFTKHIVKYLFVFSTIPVSLHGTFYYLYNWFLISTVSQKLLLHHFSRF